MGHAQFADLGTAPSIRRRKGKLSSGLWLVNGRLVSKTLSDPQVREAVNQSMTALRQDKDALRAYYVRMGILDKSGKLSKNYGG
ncbi:hypothetical protein [Ottowia testudinis]|uniref:Uncharacterized protein n=1 Tax=Ottowia testudinis TaxID=2816950 RepID=A0A975H2V0_9BURK|nr:hypothetical protein [Ottowia testudinis]QTD44581.1 hypothetical protein J1M35_16005 [Ottowia testudinis]